MNNKILPLVKRLLKETDNIGHVEPNYQYMSSLGYEDWEIFKTANETYASMVDLLNKIVDESNRVKGVKPITFQEKMKLIREDQGLSKADVSREMGYENHYSYSHYENSDSLPNLRTVIKIAEAYDLTLDELLEGVEIDLGDGRTWVGYCKY